MLHDVHLIYPSQSISHQMQEQHSKELKLLNNKK